MDRQEIFDTVAKHLLQQGVAATESTNPRDYGAGCKYRTQDGRKCAFGCLIPDELYDPKMEGKNAHYVLYAWELGKKLGIAYDDWELILELQSAHDSLLLQDGLQAWKIRMKRIATVFDLDDDVLEDK